VSLFTGCSTLGGLRLRSPYQSNSVPRPRFSADPQVEEVVDHLNRNVEKLHSWQAHNVKIRANNLPLSGTLAVEEGQRLRLVVESLAGNEVDMGSNEDVFWIWAKRMEPAYVFCRHEQIDQARAEYGIPFEPEWLMQALGVAPLDTQNLTMQIDPTGKRARLVQQVVTAHGQPLQKVITVDLVQGVIIQHEIFDAHGRLIAQARLEDYRSFKDSDVVLPRRVRLDWPQSDMSLVLTFNQIEVNPGSISAQIWEMPQMPGVEMVDLGQELSQPRPSRTVEITRDRAVDQPATTAASEEDDTGRVRLTFDQVESDDVPTPEIQFEPEDGPLHATEFSTAPIERPADPEFNPSPAAEPARPGKPRKREWWED